MPAKRKKDETCQALTAYLQIARELDPDTHPINIKTVATGIGVSRTTIYKYELVASIQCAREYQIQNADNNPAARQRHKDKVKIQELMAEVDRWRQRCLAQAAELAIMDENAQRHGIDPEALRKPPPKPDRSRSHASRQTYRQTPQ